MKYVFEGGPRDAEISEELPLGYAVRQADPASPKPVDEGTVPAEWLGLADDALMRSLPEHELTMTYDINRKVAADWHEPDAGRKAIAAHHQRLARAEMKRRGIFDSHRPI